MALQWKPWHQVVQLRDDLKSGELSLAQFAADLYDVVMGTARPIYQHTEEFSHSRIRLTHCVNSRVMSPRDYPGRLIKQCVNLNSHMVGVRHTP